MKNTTTRYITRKQASKIYSISLVTLDKYLQLGKIRRIKRGHQVMIDQDHLQEYMDIRSQIGSFENTTLFDSKENKENKEPIQEEEKQENKEPTQASYDLAIMGGLHNIIDKKDQLLEEKNKEIQTIQLQANKEIRIWSSLFWVVLTLLVCAILFFWHIMSVLGSDTGGSGGSGGQQLQDSKWGLG
jgi:hypothetical protein